MRYLYILLCLILLLSCQDKREEKYARWNEILESHLLDYEANIKYSMLHLRWQVRKEGKTEEGRERISRALDLQRKSRPISSFLDSLKIRIKNTSEQDLPKLLIGTQKNGQLYRLQNKITDFKAWIERECSDLDIETHFPNQSINDSLVLPYYKKSILEKLDFMEDNISKLSKNEALKLIYLQRNYITILMENVLKRLGAFQGYYNYFPPEPSPIIHSKADTIIQNTDYQGIMFLSSRRWPRLNFWYLKEDDEVIFPNYSVNEKALREGEQTWQGQIYFADLEYLKDTLIPISQKYYVLSK